MFPSTNLGFLKTKGRANVLSWPAFSNFFVGFKHLFYMFFTFLNNQLFFVHSLAGGKKYLDDYDDMREKDEDSPGFINAEDQKQKIRQRGEKTKR